MKASQRFVVEIEQLKMVVRFDDLDQKLLPIVAKLEKEGDLFGPVLAVIFAPDPLCVSIRYADKRRGPVKPTIFGYDSDDLMSKQYK